MGIRAGDPLLWCSRRTEQQLDAYRCIRVCAWGLGIVTLTSEGRRARPQHGQMLEDCHMQHACQDACQVPKERGIRCEQLDVNQLSPRHILHQTSTSAAMIEHRSENPQAWCVSHNTYVVWLAVDNRQQAVLGPGSDRTVASA